MKIDSRLRISRVTHPTLPLERTYCVHCGKPKGWVSIDTFEHIRASQIIVLCDACDQLLVQRGDTTLIKAAIEEIK